MNYHTSRDRNGNKTLIITPKNARGFSIQTMGNLPKTHRHGVGDYTPEEVRDYVLKCGTARQRAIMERD